MIMAYWAISFRDYLIRFSVSFLSSFLVTSGCSLFFNHESALFGVEVASILLKYSAMCSLLPGILSAAVFRRGGIGMILSAQILAAINMGVMINIQIKESAHTLPQQVSRREAWTKSGHETAGYVDFLP